MTKTAEIPLVWLQGGACSGCVVSLLNSFSPRFASLVLRELTPGTHVSLRFVAPAMASQGRQALEMLRDETVKDNGGYVLVMDGTLQLGDAMFATLGEENGREVAIHERATELARNAMAVVCMGTCASFGGIPAAQGNLTGAASMSQLLQREGITVPLLNIPGCPPQPDWLVGTLVAIVRYGLEAVAADTDELKRPKMYYGKNIHETCPRRADFDAARFARKFGDSGCLYQLGCKGPVTFADCPTRMWNSGTNWCVGAGSPCHGCVEPEFPDRLSPLYDKIDEERMGRFKLLNPHAPSASKS